MSFRFRYYYDDITSKRRGLTFFRTFLATALVGCSLIGVAASRSPSVSTDAGRIALSLYRPHVVVLKSVGQLYLFDGNALIREYPIKLGPVPTGQKQRAADGRTPEGKFQICSKNARSPYSRFLGISYPDRTAVERGLASGLITAGEGAAIRDALDHGRCPNWTTGLGGGIGIHGSADSIAQTAGCIALSDTHIDELFDVLRIGDEVEILP